MRPKRTATPPTGSISHIGPTRPTPPFEIKSVAVKDPVIVNEIVVTRVLKIVRVTGTNLVSWTVLVRGVDRKVVTWVLAVLVPVLVTVPDKICLVDFTTSVDSVTVSVNCVVFVSVLTLLIVSVRKLMVVRVMVSVVVMIVVNRSVVDRVRVVKTLEVVVPVVVVLLVRVDSNVVVVIIVLV